MKKILIIIVLCIIAYISVWREFNIKIFDSSKIMEIKNKANELIDGKKLDIASRLKNKDVILDARNLKSKVMETKNKANELIDGVKLDVAGKLKDKDIIKSAENLKNKIIQKNIEEIILESELKQINNTNINTKDNDEEQTNIDWQVGHFSAYYLDMGLDEVPQTIKIKFMQNISHAFRQSLMNLFVLPCIDSRHYYMTLLIEDDLKIFNIYTRIQELWFVAEFDWRAATNIDITRSIEEKNLKLKFIKITPINNNNVLLNLENYLNESPKLFHSPNLTFYTLNNKEVLTDCFKYIRYSWQNSKYNFDYTELYEQDKFATSYIILSGKNTANSIKSYLESMKDVLTPEKLSVFMKEFERRNWKMGYGLVREYLGIPWSGISNPRKWTDWPEWLIVDSQNLIYLLVVNGNFRMIKFHFDDKGILDKTEIMPYYWNL